MIIITHQPNKAITDISEATLQTLYYYASTSKQVTNPFTLACILAFLRDSLEPEKPISTLHGLYNIDIDDHRYTANIYDSQWTSVYQSSAYEAVRYLHAVIREPEQSVSSYAFNMSSSPVPFWLHVLGSVLEYNHNVEIPTIVKNGVRVEWRDNRYNIM